MMEPRVRKAFKATLDPAARKATLDQPACKATSARLVRQARAQLARKAWQVRLDRVARKALSARPAPKVRVDRPDPLARQAPVAARLDRPGPPASLARRGHPAPQEPVVPLARQGCKA